ncbi:LADA_0A02828g1_1 [Lachancea dasiensis]|uniref:LADA_0A02828g1_1 n=1 Tax=Lachancea dasiensis TaxID=1072105 RepID=A0A1G4IMS5_9SACH|nr:LADA_0A02828g1_1 [Lachancea dasiensis]
MAPAKTGSRTFSGCWACRFKKRRCDEKKPVCSLCLLHGDKCSFDVRLIWQNENTFSVNKARELVSWKELKNLSRRSKSYRISKRDFCKMTQFRQMSPPNSGDEDDGVIRNDDGLGVEVKSTDPAALENDGGALGAYENNEERSHDQGSSFTISVRRLKIYQNALDCVHRKNDGHLDFDQGFVNDRLSSLLTCLEEGRESSPICRSGPFGLFTVKLEDSTSMKKHKAVAEPLKRRKSESVFSWASGLPDTPLSQNSTARPSTTDTADQFLAYHWPNLLLNNNGNFCLQQAGYVKWLTGHVRELVSTLNPGFMEEIMYDKLQASHWLRIIPQFSTECQALYLLLIVMVDKKQDFMHYVSRWVQSQTKATYLSFPLIAHTLNRDTNITNLIHCHELLSEAGLQDLYQYDMTSMLKINTVRLILQHWSNVMMDQICQCKETTHAEMQLKFWELQLQCNEEFYRDICLA